MPLRILSWIGLPLFSPRDRWRVFYARRALHYSFWRHGATDLALPLWWDLSLLSLRLSWQRVLPGQDIESAEFYAEYRAPTSIWVREVVDRASKKFRTLPLLTKRRYTSLVDLALNQSGRFLGVPQGESAHVFDWLQLLDKADVRETDDPEKKRLFSIIRSGIPEAGEDKAYDDVWDCYTKMSRGQLDWETVVSVTNYMSFSTREEDKMRILFLVENEAPADYLVWKNTVLSLYLDKVERAVSLYSQSVTLGGTMRLAPELILAHAIRSNMWHLAIRCFSVAMQTRPPESVVAHLWSYAVMIPDPSQRAIEFFEFARDNLSLRQDGANMFARHLTAIALSQVPRAEGSFDRLLSLVREQDLEDKFLCEGAIIRMLNLVAVDPSSAKVLHCLQKLWSSYRKYCLPGNANKHVVHSLLRAFTTYRASWASTDKEQRRLVLDILSTCSLKHIPLDYGILVSLMEMYAWRGNIESVELLNSHLPRLEGLSDRNHTERGEDIRRMVCLIRVYSVRGDVHGAELQFEYIKRVYPSALRSSYIWREMIRLYATYQKLDMAFKTAFETMPEAGVPLDKATLMSLLWLCGWSGDPSGALSLLSIAQERAITLDPWILRYLVLALLKNRESLHSDTILSQMPLDKHKNAATAVWNGRMAIFASKRDVKMVHGLYHQMSELGIPKSRQTYLILIQMLSNVGGADEVARLLKRIIPRTNIVVDGSFFSLLIRAYARDLRFKDAIKVYTDMLSSGFVPDTEARTQYLLSKAMLLRSRTAYDETMVSELKHMLRDRGENVTWRKTEASVWYRCHTDSYFATLIMAYSEVGASHVVDSVKEEYWRNQAENGLSDDPPLGILHAFIKSASVLDEHALADELWGKCLSRLRRHVDEISRYSLNISAAAEKLLKRKPPDGETSGLAPASVEREPAKTAQDQRRASLRNLPPSIRAMLSRPLTSYLHNLASRKLHGLMVSTVENVLSEGFTLSSRAMNCHVQLLCDSPDPHIIISAFKIAEHFIMPKVQPTEPTSVNETRGRRSGFSKFDLSTESKTVSRLRESWLAATETTLPGEVLDVDQEAVRLSDVLQQAAPALSQFMIDSKNRFGDNSPQTCTTRHMARAIAAAEKRQTPPKHEIQEIATAMSFSEINSLLLLSDTASKYLGPEESTADDLSAWELPLAEASRGRGRAGAPQQDMDATSSLRLGEHSELTAANVIRLLSKNLERSRDVEASRVVAGEYASWESAVSSMSLRKGASDTESRKKAG
jgi:pentatricopeptide repeat protein